MYALQSLITKFYYEMDSIRRKPKSNENGKYNGEIEREEENGG